MVVIIRSFPKTSAFGKAALDLLSGVSGMTRKTYALEGLCCPNCAAEIDEEVKRLSEVRRASVDFPGALLTVEFDGDENALFESIAGIARNVDEDIVVKAL
jgi:Cd2+/Zn2+-exporting ATPase